MKERKKSDDVSARDPLVCLICGDVARGLNFNLTTCMSCKAFFRRNALKKSLVSKCQFGGFCQINVKTRSFCSPCRLKKCFDNGMNSELIRRLPVPNRKPKKSQSAEIKNPRSLQVLRKDQSVLTKDQWNILSSFIRTFDEQNPGKKIQSTLHQLSSLPPKLRLKSSDIYNIVSQFFIGIQSLIEHSPDLNALSINARRALTKHNLSSAGLLNAIFICRELNLYGNEIFSNACNLYYGTDFLLRCAENSHRCDPNGNLIKVLIFIMTYSSNCSIVLTDHDEDINTMASSKDIIHFQDAYATILWKYMVYLYGYEQAVVRFSSLVKSILDIIHMLEIIPTNERHKQMVNTIVTQTQRILIINE